MHNENLKKVLYFQSRAHRIPDPDFLNGLQDSKEFLIRVVHILFRKQLPEKNADLLQHIQRANLKIHKQQIHRRAAAVDFQNLIWREINQTARGKRDGPAADAEKGIAGDHIVQPVIEGKTFPAGIAGLGVHGAPGNRPQGKGEKTPAKGAERDGALLNLRNNFLHLPDGSFFSRICKNSRNHCNEKHKYRCAIIHRRGIRRN